LNFDNYEPLAKAGAAHRFFQKFACFLQDASVGVVLVKVID
jgi:hypothetical protein